MPHVLLSLNYLERLKQMLRNIKQDLRNMELVETDLGTSSFLELQIQRLESIYGGLQDIKNNPQKYLVI